MFYLYRRQQQWRQTMNIVTDDRLCPGRALGVPSRIQRRSDMVSAMSEDDKKATDGTADETDTLKHIGGSQSESSPHTRCANALADGIASQVALPRRFNIRVMLRIGKAKTSMKTTLVAVLWLENPKLPMPPTLENRKPRKGSRPMMARRPCERSPPRGCY